MNLLKPHGTKFAILLSSLLFALGHPSIGAVTAFIGGILLSRITLYYDSILPAMFVHFLHNAILQLTIEVFIVLMCLLPCCFLYFLFKGDYKKYFDIPMIPDAGNCWHSLLTPYKIIFLLLLLVFSFL